MLSEKVKQALEQIQACIDSGESISMSRKKVCGTPTSKLAEELMRTQEYVDILNAYMVKIGKPIRYKLVGRRLEWANAFKIEEN